MTFKASTTTPADNTRAQHRAARIIWIAAMAAAALLAAGAGTAHAQACPNGNRIGPLGSWSGSQGIYGIFLGWDANRDNLWTAGEEIRINVRFQKWLSEVDTSDGQPTLAIELGDDAGYRGLTREATYVGREGKADMVFAYEVGSSDYRSGAADQAVRAIRIPPNSFRKNRARIRSDQGIELDVRHNERCWNDLMDPLRPKIRVSSTSRNGVTEGNPHGFEIRLFSVQTGVRATYNDATTVSYATVDGTAVAGRDYTTKSGTVTFAPGESSTEIEVLTHKTGATEGGNFTLRLSDPRSTWVYEPTALIVGAEAEGVIKNTSAGGGAGEPLTAAFENTPAEGHNGESAFAMRIRFSEGIATSTTNMRTHALAVTGASVTSAGKVDADASLWEIAVLPSSDDPVTISLTPGRSCDRDDAVCTADGRQLHSGAAISIPRAQDQPEPEPDPLTAALENVPDSHDGENLFTFRVRFSEDIGISYRALREDAFVVTGGEVTRGRRVDDRRDLFEMTVRPAGNGAVTINLPANRECTTSGAICTKGENRRQLTNSPLATVAGPSDERSTNTPATGAPTISGTPQVGEALAASTSGISDADGLDDARFAHQWMRADSDISGATGPAYTPVAADEGERLKVRVSFTDDAGNAESLTSASTDAVAARPVPLTARFEGMPAEHPGEGGFTFRVAFSEDIGISFRSLREDAFTVTGGRVTGGSRVDGRRDLFRMPVRPDSDGDVTITLPAGRDCGVSGAICTKGENRRQLTNSPSATVRGPVGISVADARVDENAGALLAFAVTLTRAGSGTVTVDYATANGSATAGDDYTAASGTLTFQAGESSKTIEVTVLDDSHDEGEETLTLRLSNAAGGRVADGTATGTIVNRDPLPRALLARFGRAAAVHVVEHVEERMEAPREPGFRGEVAGRELRRGMDRDVALQFLSQLGGRAGVHTPRSEPGVAGATRFGTPGVGGGVGMPGAGGGVSAGVGMRSGAPGAMGAPAGTMGGTPGPAGGPLDGGLYAMGLGGDSLLTGSSFSLNRETSRGGILSFWSRGARSSFRGREGALALGGDVRTTMFGTDYAKGPLVVGLSLARSQGLGDYAGTDAGRVASAVTGLYPWIGYNLNERVSVWGVTGYGAGGLLLTPEGGPALESGLSMKMSAAGTRGELVPGGEDGFGLAFKADALWVGTATDGVDGPAGRLAATAAAVSRVRTALEGSRGFTFGRGLSLKPSVEVGVRHDAGDAEQGAGMDVGGGLVVSDASTGLAVDVRVRMLLVHEADDFRERGVSVSVSYNPTPQTPLGLTARVAPSWGGQAQSGAEALWGRDTMAGMAHGGLASGNRLDGEVGYGLPVGSRFVGTPRVGFTTSEYGRDYRVGYALAPMKNDKLTFQVGVDAQRRESPTLRGTSNGLLGRASVGW